VVIGVVILSGIDWKHVLAGLGAFASCVKLEGAFAGIWIFNVNVSLYQRFTRVLRGVLHLPQRTILWQNSVNCGDCSATVLDTFARHQLTAN
jgi:hypothetical protein